MTELGAGMGGMGEEGSRGRREGGRRREKRGRRKGEGRMEKGRGRGRRYGYFFRATYLVESI